MVSTTVFFLGLLVAATESKSPSPPAAAVPETTLNLSDKQNESTLKMEAAAARQRAAAQVQTTAVPEGSFFSAGWSGPSLIPAPAQAVDCAPMAEPESEPLIRAAALRHQLNPNLIKAVIRQESGFRACAVSPKGAMGLMQVMPDTANSLKTVDPFDPAQNIEAGASYLKQMLGRFKGDVRLALAAYNAGPERVDGVTPAVPNIPETRDYVETISKALQGEPAEVAKAPQP